MAENKKISHLFKNTQSLRVEVNAISTPSTLPCGRYLPSLTTHHILSFFPAFLPCLFYHQTWGSKHSLDFPALLPSLQLSKSFKTQPKSHLFQKALTNEPSRNNSVPGLCAEMGCSLSISHNSLCIRSLLSWSVSLVT